MLRRDAFPVVLADTAQRTLDRALRLGLTTRPLGGHVGLVRRDAYQPVAQGQLAVIPGFAPTQAATYLEVDGWLQPINALTVRGWFETPNTPGHQPVADFQPPVPTAWTPRAH